MPLEFTESGPDSRDRLRLLLRDREGHRLLRLTADEAHPVAPLPFEDQLAPPRAALERGETPALACAAHASAPRFSAECVFWQHEGPDADWPLGPPSVVPLERTD